MRWRKHKPQEAAEPATIFSVEFRRSGFAAIVDRPEPYPLQVRDVADLVRVLSGYLERDLRAHGDKLSEVTIALQLPSGAVVTLSQQNDLDR